MKNGQKVNVLLLGNGINRAYDFGSWDNLLKSIQKQELTIEQQKTLDGIPYPLQAVIRTGDDVDTRMFENAKELTEMSPPVDEKEVLRACAGLPVDAILTTNYTYELEKSLAENFSCKIGSKCRYRGCTKPDAGKFERTQLHTVFDMGDGAPPIWHIHGEAAKHQTMIIGHYYYGKLIAKAQQYIANHMAIYKSCLSGKINFTPNSWIDYLMLGDVYIVGLGMDISEMDLWWLVSCKKLHFPNTRVVLYKPDIKPAERMLAETYKIDIVDGGLSGDDYKSYYRWVIEQLTILISRD